MKKAISTVTLLVFILLPGLALAKHGRGMEGQLPRGKWWQHKEIAEKLNLAPGEIEKLDAAYINLRRKLISLKSDLELQRFELGNMLESKTVDESAAMKQFNALEKARNGLAKETFIFLLEVREILGLERYLELKNSYKRFRGRMGRAEARRGRPGRMATE
jgi:hypothetical protein